MKVKFILTFIFFTYQISLACDCKPELDFNKKEDLFNYDFISHVKIKSIQNIDNNSEFIMHRVFFEILNHYKGEKTNSILIYGSNKNLGSSGLCDLNENVEEEWILFGTRYTDSKSYITSKCSRSLKIKEKDGYEDISYPFQITLRERLNKIYGKPSSLSTYEGIHEEFYPNKVLKLKEYYINQKIEGERKIWYPNGILESEQFYTKGKKQGVFKWYSKKGNLIKIEKFNNGVLNDTTTILREPDSLDIDSEKFVIDDKIKLEKNKSLIWLKQVFNNKGEITYRLELDKKGEKYTEIFYYPEIKKYTLVQYHPNGKKSSESTFLKGKLYDVYFEWDQNGNLTNSWEYDEQGKIIKDSVKKI